MYFLNCIHVLHDKETTDLFYNSISLPWEINVWSITFDFFLNKLSIYWNQSNSCIFYSTSTQSHSLEMFSTISLLANQTEISTEPSSTNDDDERWWMVWVQLACLVLAAFGIMAKMFKKFKSCCKSCVDTLCVERGRAGQPNQEEEMSTVHNEEIVICYLCNKKVSVAQWNDRETGHRSYCAVKSKNHRGTLCSFWLHFLLGRMYGELYFSNIQSSPWIKRDQFSLTEPLFLHLPLLIVHSPTTFKAEVVRDLLIALYFSWIRKNEYQTVFFIFLNDHHKLT